MKDGLHSWCKSCFNKRNTNYQKLNKDKKSAWQKKYYYKNREKILEHQKLFQKQKRKIDPDFREKEKIKYHNRQARIRKNGGTFTLKEWRALKKKCNYTCQKCFKKEPAIKLTIDHIIALFNKGENTIKNIQPLCGSCNSIKGTKW